MVRLALRKRKGGPWAYLIRRWTRSEYDHCELVVGDWWYSSLFRSGGMRVTLEPPKGEFDFIDLPWVSKGDVERYAVATDGQGYDWLAIVGHVFRGRWQLSQAATCGGWCAVPMGLPQPEAYDPGLLGELAQAINEIRGK